MPENILQLGINVAELETQKQQALSIYKELFEQLTQYQAKAFSSIGGGGLIEFNTSLTATKTLLDEMNTKFATLAQTSEKVANASKALSQEEKLKAAAIKEAATAQANADKAKTVEETNRRKQAAAEYKLEQQRVVGVLKELAIQQDKVDKQKTVEANNAKKASVKALATEERLRTQELKQQTIAEENAVRASQQEDKVNKTLLSDYALLKLALKDQADAYANLVINKGKNAPETKEALATFAASSDVIAGIDKQLAKAGDSSKLLGSGLRSAFGSLRTLAYILPGIGIAGLFNLAFEAIGHVVEQMGLLNDTETKQIEFTNKLRESWLELENAMLGVYDANRKLGDFDYRSYQSNLNKTATDQTRGISQDIILTNELANAKERLARADKEHDQIRNGATGIQGFVNQNIDINNQIAENANEINNQKEIISGHSGTTLFGRDDPDRIRAEAEVKRLQDLNAQLEFDYKNNEKIVEEYYNATADLSKKNAELLKFNEDQIRKRIFENAKSEISVNQDKNKKILDDDISSETQRHDALLKLRNDRIALNQADFTNIKNNNSTTPEELNIARQRLSDENKKANIEFTESDEKLFESYRQRRLKAQEGIDKDQLERNAITNERIYQNDKNGLDTRLKAYFTYIQDKQKQQELEYQLSIDTLALKSDDPTAKKEIEKLKADRDLEKSNIKANAEKQIYDIVYSYGKKQLQAVIDENILEHTVNKENHTIALEELNESYKNRNITIEKYKREKLKLDRKYAIYELDEQIVRDHQDIERLKKAEQDKLDVKLKVAKSEYAASLATGVGIPEAEGKYQALLQVQDDFDKEIKGKEDQLQSDRHKRAEIGFNDDTKQKSLWAKEIKAIENQVYKSVKEYVDKGYEYRLEQIEKHKSLIDEQYGYEIDAIEKSTLSAKDKAALDIQLQEQKQEFDRNAAVEEKRLKIEQAEFDKKLSIAHIIFGTAQAVIAGVPPSPKSIAAGIVGAIELGAAIATQIPSYSEGVKSHKGGKARYGEAGPELVKEPYKSPYLVMSETIGYLPKGTEVIPIKDSPVFGEKSTPDNWDQVKWLAKKLEPKKSSIRNVTNIDLGFEMYKHKKLYGG